jgi:aminoglycoside phosphotransferase
MGPFGNREQFHDYLLAPVSRNGFSSEEEFQAALGEARKIRHMSHRIVFTHGDFKAHNILVDDDGHLSGFIDWECAGWQPEYWEFTTSMRSGQHSWWYQVALRLGGEQYLEELRYDSALNRLTVDSYVGFF